jgi:retinol dehydrogenase-12
MCIRILFIMIQVTKMKWDDLNLEKNNPGPFFSYCQSKLANCLFTVELAERFGSDGITSVSVHPGTVVTNIARDIGKRMSITMLLLLTLYPLYLFVGKTSRQGAQTSIHCAVDDDLPSQNGKYFA